MYKKTLDRRTLLRGILAGSAVSIALPPLEAFLNVNGTAYASDSTFPKRFGLFFWGNGMHIDRWVPTSDDVDWELPEQLVPLSAIKDRVTLITGMEVKVPNTLAHGSGVGGLLTGNEILIYNSEDYTFTGPSIDQIIAKEIGGSTKYRSIEVGVQSECHGYSFFEAGTRNYPETDIALIFERLFGAGFREPGEEGIVDPTLALRRSVLDSVLEDAARLENRLGTADKQRLEQHMDSIRDLEIRIALMESAPPNYAACERPEEPEEIPDIDGRPQMSERSKVISDLVAMAYACDITRVQSIWYSDTHNNILFPEATAGHHQLTHDEPDDQPQVNSIMLSIMSDFSYFLEKLDSIEEGDGTLLDNSLILCTSDVSYGRTHQIDEFPILLAGNAGGKIQNGIHYRSYTKENASHVPFSCMQAMDVYPGSFGSDDGEVNIGLSAIEV
jgi:hypothetical protein